MAFKQTLIHRIFNNISNHKQSLRNCRISPSSAAQTLIPPNSDPIPPDPHPLFRLPEILRPGGQPMLNKLKEMDITRNRIRLDGLSPPVGEFTVADAKKVIRASQIEKLKRELNGSCRNYVSYDEFVGICVEGCGNREQGLDVAKALDDSGSVIVLGDVVFLHPEQVVKAIHGLLPTNLQATHDPPVKELEEMEQWKSIIDTKAKKMVQRELWGGLAYLMVQTAGFIRLTFWELSWDVMEPICVYLTSLYFMGGYAFFLRTAKEPSFEGFFQSRFSSKQKKLMKREGFDMDKYNKLRKACYAGQEAWSSENLIVDEGVKRSILEHKLKV